MSFLVTTFLATLIVLAPYLFGVAGLWAFVLLLALWVMVVVLRAIVGRLA